MKKKIGLLVLIIGVLGGGLGVSAFATSPVARATVCTGYLGSWSASWTGYYQITLSAYQGQVVLNGNSYSLTNCYPTPHGNVCSEANYPAFVLSSDTPFGSQPGVSVGVKNSSDPNSYQAIGRLTQCSIR
jgi:hypothetical protein